MRVTQAFGREGTNADRFAGAVDAYRRSRLRAQRYIAMYFPFVQLLSDVGGGRWCSCSARARVRAGSADRRRADRLPALPRPVLLADPAALPGLRRLPAGARSACAASVTCCERRPSTPQAEQPRCRSAGSPADRASTTCASPTARAASDDALHAASTLRIAGRARPSRSSARPAPGKSTLVKLIARFYDPTGGAVLVDGIDVRELRPDRVPPPARRRAAGGVPVPGTVRDAIAYGRPEATDAEVEAAARAVGAHDDDRRACRTATCTQSASAGAICPPGSAS